MRVLRPVALNVAALALGTGLVFAAESNQPTEKPYTITDGKVDRKTFNGWRRYTESCLRCHGPDGAGSSYAPSLVDSTKHLSQDEFNEIVINGRTNVNCPVDDILDHLMRRGFGARIDGERVGLGVGH